MTNEHCIQNQSDADNVTIEFMAEGANCTINCDSWFACVGTIEATSATLVRVNAPLDYALLGLANNVTGTYGFLQLRESGAKLNERIYIPQHPKGWGKRIALLSSNSNDDGGVARVFSLTRPRCGENSGNDVGYYADTQGGSSGSPVLGYDDNLVVALHHCAKCPNRGVPIEEIVADLGDGLPNNAISNCEDEVAIIENVLSGSTDNQQASTSITASNVIENGATANYSAGQSVTLLSGFHAQLGSSFIAIIGDCESTENANNARIAKNEIETNYQKNNDNALEEGLSNGDIVLYPNPSDHTLYIQFNDESTANKVSIYNSAGAKVLKVDLDNQNRKIDVRVFKNGVYFIKIFNTETGEVKTKKIIIQK